MDEPPDYDFVEEEEDFEQLCREELMQMEEMGMEMEPDDYDVDHGTDTGTGPVSGAGNTINAVPASGAKAQTKGDTSIDLYTSPHKLYQSPEVFKSLNNEFSSSRNAPATTLSFGEGAPSTAIGAPSPQKVQQNIASRGPQILNLLNSCLFTTQLPAFTPLQAASSRYLDDRPLTTTNEEYATITIANGARKYLRPRTAPARDASVALPASGGMLDRPMSAVLKEAEESKTLKLAAERTRALEKQRMLSTAIPSASDTSIDIPAFNLDKELWVDKYSPKSFTQLLSSEKINREVLRCIKLWDKFVFNRSTQKAERRYYDFKGNIIDKPEYFQNKGQNKATKSSEVEEGGHTGSNKATPDTRPEFKLILLAGPPGTGKTTLAHIVAQHCGYRTIEVNASDDRSVASLRDIIARSMSNNTLDEHFIVEDNSARGKGNVMGSSKPNCIILDEIDGMDGREPIDALIAIAKAGLDSNKKHKGGGGASKKENIVLTRPVICICNDQFSPILRDLRKYAQVFVFAPSTDARLVGRLKQICSQEGILSVASSSLSALSQASGGDIRSAINTLQFAAMRAQAQVKASSTASSDAATSFQKSLGTMITSGLKDERQDVFQLWSQIFSFKEAAAKFAKKFQLLSNGSSSKGNSDTSADSGGIGSRGTHAMRVLDTILGYNDHQLILSGVQENYLGVKFTDPNLIKAASAADWLSIGNMLQGKMGSGDVGSHSTSKYIPGIIAVVHLLCASDTSSHQQQRLQYPKKEADCRYSHQQREHILQQFYEGACIRSKCISSKMVSALDCIPYILDVLAMGGSGPGAVRPGPLQSQTDSEKDRIQRVTDIMMSCNLSYERQTVVDSYREKRSPYLLEPAIEVFTLYDEEGEEYAERRGAHATSSEVKHLLYLEVRAQIQKALYAREKEAIDQRGSDRVEEVPEEQVQMETTEEIKKLPDVVADTPEMVGLKRSIAETEGKLKDAASKSTPSPEKKAKVGNSEKKYFSFFKPPQASSSKSGTTGPVAVSAYGELAKKKKKTMRYKFCSGFSNAVKRPVSIREFM